MARTANYKKWQEIYLDSNKGMSWNELVSKHKCSKSTISKAINFFKNLDKNDLNDIMNKDLKLALAHIRIEELENQIKELRSKRKFTEVNKSEVKGNQLNGMDRSKKIIQILEALQNITRLRMIIMLYIYNELSLGGLAKKIGISKSTASRHLKIMQRIGLIRCRTEKSRSPRAKQFFSATPEIIEMVRLSRSVLRTISPEKALEARLKDINVDALLFSVMNLILNEIISYYEKFEKKIREYRPSNHQKIEELFSTENTCRYYLWYFDEQQFEIFKERYKEFFNKLREELNDLENKRYDTITLEKPFLVWYLLIPLKKVFNSQ